MCGVVGTNPSEAFGKKKWANNFHVGPRTEGGRIQVPASAVKSCVRRHRPGRTGCLLAQTVEKRRQLARWPVRAVRRENSIPGRGRVV